MPEGVMVAIIFEDGDKIKEKPEEGLLELDPSSEIDNGNTQACATCKRAFGFKFEELWGGYRSEIRCQTCCQAPACSCC